MPFIKINLPFLEKLKIIIIVKNTGSVGGKFNNCIYRRDCPNRGRRCEIYKCSEFKEEKCTLLNKPPYVCNGCKQKNQCTLTRHFYEAVYSQNEYIEKLSDVRKGVIINQDEINHLSTQR